MLRSDGTLPREERKFTGMTTRFLAVLLTAMLALAGVTLAQDAPASGGSAPTTTTAPAPDVNVDVSAPAPAAPQVNVEAPPSTSTTTNNTSVTRESTVVQDAPAESWVNPWILIGGGVALVIVLLFIAMAAGSGTDRTVTTVS